MPLTPNRKKEVRSFISNYCRRAEANKTKIHYAQIRPMRSLGKAPEAGFTADCSEFTTAAFYWADIHTPGYKVNDPNGLKYNYNGYGYTGTLLANNVRGRVPFDHLFWVGDMAIYGPNLGYTKHVVICRKNGHRKDALWTSHGNESGPYTVYLDYRSDLLVVLRANDLK